MAESAPKVLLASASPRRRSILAALGVPFETVELEVDERALPKEEPEGLACRLAVAKATQAARQSPGRIVLGADTVVAVGRRVLGKPRSPVQASRMLRRLRGQSHRVITAVAAVRSPEEGQPEAWTRVAVTRVWMREYTDDEIRDYVASGGPFDKAGGYAIQDPVFHPVDRIEGCFLTVVGLPLPEVCDVLARAGLPLPMLPATALPSVCPSCTCVTEHWALGPSRATSR